MGVMKRLYEKQKMSYQDDSAGRNNLGAALYDLATNTTRAERKKLADKVKTSSYRDAQLKMFDLDEMI